MLPVRWNYGRAMSGYCFGWGRSFFIFFQASQLPLVCRSARDEAGSIYAEESSTYVLEQGTCPGASWSPSKDLPIKLGLRQTQPSLV
jgi:hypothetical protein